MSRVLRTLVGWVYFPQYRYVLRALVGMVVNVGGRHIRRGASSGLEAIVASQGFSSVAFVNCPTE